METGLKGKVVVITGGGGGIGEACALAFAAEGAKIVVADLTVAEWDQLMAINLKGVFLCSQGALRVMKPQRSGKIVNLASMGGQVGGIVAGADYSSSKAGVLCFTKSLAKNAGPFGINVNAVNPGVIDTPMTKPWGEELLQKRIDE